MDYQQILGALSNMAPKDPAAVNPATTEAMARSRDTISRILERSLGRQADPFAGMNDVATAATAALASRGRTPFGAALEQAELGRAQKTSQIAGTLGTLASKEAALSGRGSMTPYQSAQFAMRQLQFLAGRGDKEAALVNQTINQIRTNLEPEDAVGFVVDSHAALQEAQRQAGRPLGGDEAVAIVTRQAAQGGYRARLPNLQGFVNPVTGDREVMNPKTGQWGAGAASSGAIPRRAPVVSVTPGASPLAGVQPALPPSGATTPEPILRNPTRVDSAPLPAPQASATSIPQPAKGIPAAVAKPHLMGMPETAGRLDMILRARGMAENVPDALGVQGALVDAIGGLVQQGERALGVPGALSSGMRVNEISQARDQFNLLFAKLIPTVTGDSSGRYSNFDVQLAQRMSRMRSSLSSVEQVRGFLNLMRDIEVRTLRKQMVLSGDGGTAIYNTFSPEVKAAIQNPAIVGPDGEAPYDNFKTIGSKVYVRMKGTGEWREMQW